MNRRAFFQSFVPSDVAAAEERPDPPPEIRAVPVAGSPRQYEPGDWVLVEEARAWLACDAIGFYAVDAVCPHLGCIVRASEDGLVCPCHGSRFDFAGTPRSGPAPAGLRFLEVDLDDDDNLIIRRDRTVPPDDRFIA